MRPVGIIVTLIVGIVLLAIPISRDVTIAIVLGWVSFVRRVFPLVTIDWLNTALFIGSLVGLVVLLHAFLRWLYRETSGGARSWSLRWTAMTVVTTVLMFVAGISMIGVVHQVSWVAVGAEPMTTRALPNTGHSAIHLAVIGNQFEYGSGRWWPYAGHSWAAKMVAHRTVDPELEWDHPFNAVCYKHAVARFINPELGLREVFDERGFGLIHYAGNVRVFEGGPNDTFAPADGASNTLLIGEVNANFSPWGKPGNVRDPAIGLGRPDGFGGAAPDATQFLMVDGSVRSIPNDIDPSVLKALATPGAGEDVNGLRFERMDPW